MAWTSMPARKPGPKGPHAPRWSVRETIADLTRTLSANTPQVNVGAGRAALVHLERLATLERDVAHLQMQIADLEVIAADARRLWDAARAMGIEVFQPFGSEDWTWTRGTHTGRAPTPEDALLAALDAVSGRTEGDTNMQTNYAENMIIISRDILRFVYINPRDYSFNLCEATGVGTHRILGTGVFSREGVQSAQGDVTHLPAFSVRSDGDLVIEAEHPRFERAATVRISRRAWENTFTWD